MKLNPGLPWKRQQSTKIRLFTSKLDLNLGKKPVMCYIWRIALYGAESWTFKRIDQKYLESFEMWDWIRN